MLSEQLAREQSAGRRYLAGAALSAVDFYWATMCNLVVPLPPEQLALPDALRRTFTCRDPEVLGAISPELLAHRDLVYANHMKLPVEL